MSTKAKFTTAMLVTGSLPVILFLIISYSSTRSSIIDSKRKEAAQLARPVAAEIASTLRKVIDDINVCRRNPLLINESAAESSKLIELRRLANMHPSLKNVAIHGRGFSLSTSALAPQPAPAEAFEVTATGKFYIDRRKQVLDGEKEEPTLVIFAPMQAADEPTGGLLEAVVPLSMFYPPVASAQLSQPGPVILLDHEDRVLAHRDFRKLLATLSLPEGGKDATFKTEDGSNNYMIKAPVQSGDAAFAGDWRLVFLLPKGAIESIVAESVRVQLGAGLGALILAIMLGLWLSRKLSKTMHLTAKFGEGTDWSDFTARMPERGPSEWVEFAKKFNELFSRVETRTAELESVHERRETQLEDSRELNTLLQGQLKTTIEMIEDAVAIIGYEDGTLIEANPVFHDFIGLTPEEISKLGPEEMPETLARNFDDPGAFHDWWNDQQRDPKADCTMEWATADTDGELMTVSARPFPTDEGHIFAVVWVFELRPSTVAAPSAAPVVSGRFEQVANLTNGIACDFNHILTGMIGNLALVDADATAEEREKALFETKKIAHRGAELVRSLLAYTKRTLLTVETVRASEILEDAQQLLEIEASRSGDWEVELKIEKPEPELTLKADPKRLLDVLRTLGRNSIEAMPDGGTLTLKAEPIDTNSDVENGPMDGGDYVSFVIEDSGHGIEPDIRSRIFEPFFSTRDGHDGLGLSTVGGIIWQHDGWMSCETSVDDGAIFRVFLPAAHSYPRPDKPRPPKRDRTILVVEDEDSVRDLNEAILHRAGFDTVGAPTAEEGLRIYREYQDQISMVVLDLNMPGMDGREFFRQLRKEFGNVPVVIVSAFLLDFDAFELDGGAPPIGFVQKPFQADQLISAISVGDADERMAA
ncbi:MAG: response regulator [Verrucomicrobiota bacterium]